MNTAVLDAVRRNGLATTPRASAIGLRFALAAVCAVAIAGAALLGDPSIFAAADPELAQLLRGMALIKGMLAVAAIALVAWRFGHPIDRGYAVGYLVGCAALAAATVVIWQLSFIVAAAVAFHVGALLLLVLAWRDDGTRLRRVVAARR